MKGLCRHIILFLLFSVATQLNGQEKGLDSDAWNGTVNGVDYFEKRESLKPVEDSHSSSKKFDDASVGDKPQNEEIDRSDNSWGNGNFQIPIFIRYILIFLVIALLVYFIGYTIVKNPNVGAGKKVTSFTEEDLTSIEENLFDNDLEKFIYEAKQAGNYKLAIRFSFIYIIRLLAENGFIKWRKQKTNHDYLYELEGNSFKPSFNYCKLVFENLWYGQHSFEENALINTLSMYSEQIDKLKLQKKVS